MGASSSTFTNRLARESSPYLLQHAHNPVDWYPWGDEALAKAKAEDKPILLSVGYSACHWCHVMAHESFESEATAALMNAHFVNVKVDREERPDVDQLYQGVVALLRRGGGWPLTVFLTPDLKPFFGGTYFPGEPNYGMPAFSMILTRLADAWKNQRKEIDGQAKEFHDGLKALNLRGLDGDPGRLTETELLNASKALAGAVDPVHGGFGRGGPKFPNPMDVALLLRGHRRDPEAGLLGPALLTLEQMAKGGIHDHLGGGFHRYAVDERWLVPHFEKMLYDNAQLARLYAEGFQLSRSPLFSRTVEDTIGFMAREMREPHGGFVAAFDADSEGEEGKFFVWRPSELVEVLGADDAKVVAAWFQVTDTGTFEHGSSVLETPYPLEQVAKALNLTPAQLEAVVARAKPKLFEARAKRVPPGRDGKVLAGWNGLAIDGLAYAGRVFQRPEWVALARDAATFVLEKLRRPDGSLWRSWQGGEAKHAGLLEDYGDLALGLVTLFQATQEPRWLEAAEKLADHASTQFWDAQSMAYRASPKGTPHLLVTPYALHDNAFPSGASTLTHAHVGLAALTGRTRHLQRASAYLEHMHHELTSHPMGYGHLWLAADAFLDGAAELTVLGTKTSRAPFEALLTERFAPTVHLLAREHANDAPEVLREVLANRPSPKDGVAAFVCRDFACQAPVGSPEALQTGLGALTLG